MQGPKYSRPIFSSIRRHPWKWQFRGHILQTSVDPPPRVHCSRGAKWPFSPSAGKHGRVHWRTVKLWSEQVNHDQTNAQISQIQVSVVSQPVQTGSNWLSTSDCAIIQSTGDARVLHSAAFTPEYTYDRSTYSHGNSSYCLEWRSLFLPTEIKERYRLHDLENSVKSYFDIWYICLQYLPTILF